MYVCRTLSYKGAEFEVVEAPLEPEMMVWRTHVLTCLYEIYPVSVYLLTCDTDLPTNFLYLKSKIGKKKERKKVTNGPLINTCEMLIIAYSEFRNSHDMHVWPPSVPTHG